MDIRRFMKRKTFLIAEAYKTFQTKDWELRLDQHRCTD